MPKYQPIVTSVNEILRQYTFALTLRQIYYRLVAAGTIPNKRSAYNQLSKVLVKARENGDVDDTRIEDRSREVLKAPTGWNSPEEFLEFANRHVKGLDDYYSLNVWKDQEYYVEVWVEKDALSRVIQQTARPLRVTVCPSKGYASYTYIKREAVDDRFGSLLEDKPIIILDFRDHDPSGIQMTEDLENRFTKYGEGYQIEVRRIALTIEQVKKYDLIPNPTKLADPRSPSYIASYGNECWELDAIEPTELQRIVDDAIRDHIDEEAWEESLALEEKQKKQLARKFSKATLSFGEEEKPKKRKK